MSTTEATATARAAELGSEHGEAAASWIFDGNTDRETYVRFLVGMDEGDPEVLDQLPHADLSGEWADGMTPARLAEACGIPECDWSLTESAPTFGVVEDCCTAYEAAFSDAAQREAERIAREYVEDASSPLGRLTTAAREHSGLSYAELAEAGEHGADAGWAGFTYTRDCQRFYDANVDDIWSLVDEVADDLAVLPLALVASFNDADIVEDAPTFANLLAWFALEMVGRSLADA